jgi:hypothetical protein
MPQGLDRELLPLPSLARAAETCPRCRAEAARLQAAAIRNHLVWPRDIRGWVPPDEPTIDYDNFGAITSKTIVLTAGASPSTRRSG